MVATLVGFLDVYNAGRVDDALRFFVDEGSVSDCDYRNVSLITTTGRDATRKWLQDRAADHDQLVVRSIINENPEPSSGSHVVAASFSRRTSDTLRSLGFPNGVEPRLTAKVVFTATDDHIRAFANGPFGGSLEVCRPGP
jgi:hypothetical protein